MILKNFIVQMNVNMQKQKMNCNSVRFIASIVFVIFLFTINLAQSQTTDTINLPFSKNKTDGFFEIGSAIKINEESIACSHPRIAASSDDIVFFVWDGLLNNKRKIFFREFSNDRFKEPIVLETDLNSESSEPDITVDSKGNPHIVWVSEKDNLYSINYAFRLDDNWIYFPTVYQSNGLNLEVPVIGVANSSPEVFLAWQEGKGIDYHILAAVKNEQGKFLIYNLSEDSSDHYNLYPQIFTTPTPSVIWYESIESEFVLMGVRFDYETKLWESLELDGLTKIASNRLPIITISSSSRIAGLWYDSLDKLDKILLGLQYFNDGMGVQIDQNSIGNESQPFGIFRGNDFIFITFLESNLEENQVFFTIARVEKSGAKFLDSPIQVTENGPGYYSSPRIAIGESKIFIVWSSNVRDGGDGGIYFTLITISNV